MKHIKQYEELSKSDELKLMNQIKIVVDEITNDEGTGDTKLDDCPFLTELNILHQKEYIDDIFWDITNWPKNLTLGEFSKAYNKLIKKSIETI